MNTPRNRLAERHLALSELNPSVDLASCWHFQADQWHRYRIPGHHLLLVESGCLAARTPDGDFTARAGDLVCFRPTELNEYGNLGPTLFYQAHINFAPPPLDRLTPWLDEQGPLPVLLATKSAFEELRGYFENLCMEISQRGACHRLRLQATVFELLGLISEILAKGPARPARLDPWQRARLRLESEFEKDLKISRLARETGLSVDHFIRQFKRRFGVTPKAFRLNAKLWEAARSLRGSDRPVKAVAFELGFADAKSFVRLFKRRLGMTPSELRGSSSPGQAPPHQPSGLAKGAYPINQHQVPPEATADWFKKWMPRV